MLRWASLFSPCCRFFTKHTLKAGWPNGKTSKGSGALCIILPATTQKAALLKYWKHWQQLILNRPAVTGSTHTVKQQPADQKRMRPQRYRRTFYDRRHANQPDDHLRSTAPLPRRLRYCTEHINTHEAGAIERTGHKVIDLPTSDGKITAA